MKSKIVGVGRYFPSRIVTSEEAEEMANFKKDGVKKGLCKMLTGCEERRYAAEEEFSSDIAAMAGKAALENSGVEPGEIDAVIFCSVSHDFAEPATVNVVMDAMGIDHAFGFDVKNACNAFISGMDIADGFIQSGKARCVLVVSGEALSKWVSYDFEDREDLLMRAPVTLSIGDGGGAVVMKQSEEESESGIVKGLFRTAPQYWNNNVVWGGGVRYPRDPSKMFIPGTTKVIVDKQRDLWKEFMPIMKEEIGWDLSTEVDCYVPTQVAKWINYSMSKELNFPMEKIIQVVHKFGNVGASNIPIGLVEAVETGKLKRGDKVLMSGVGVGINIGSMAMVY